MEEKVSYKWSIVSHYDPIKEYIKERSSNISTLKLTEVCYQKCENSVSGEGNQIAKNDEMNGR